MFVMMPVPHLGGVAITEPPYRAKDGFSDFRVICLYSPQIKNKGTMYTLLLLSQAAGYCLK